MAVFAQPQQSWVVKTKIMHLAKSKLFLIDNRSPPTPTARPRSQNTSTSLEQQLSCYENSFCIHFSPSGFVFCPTCSIEVNFQPDISKEPCIWVLESVLKWKGNEYWCVCVWLLRWPGVTRVLGHSWKWWIIEGFIDHCPLWPLLSLLRDAGRTSAHAVNRLQFMHTVLPFTQGPCKITWLQGSCEWTGGQSQDFANTLSLSGKIKH